MLGLDYGSDSEGEPENTAQPSPKAIQTPPVVPKPKPTSSRLSLPAPKAAKKGTTKKILVELPKLERRPSDDDDDGGDGKPAAKRSKIDGERGARTSSLLSMLPAPKRSTMELPPPQKVLGGGRAGISYSAASSSSALLPSEENDDVPGANEKVDSSEALLPPSLLLKGKGKAKQATVISELSRPTETQETTTKQSNFFSLGSLSSSSSRLVSASPAASASGPSVSISAAPTVDDFRPPSPSPQDEYPGYYQLPSGRWAMHDPDYFKTFTDKWAKDYEAQIRAYEKGAGTGMDRGFEGAAADGAASEINALDQLDEARRVREERMELTKRTRTEGDAKMPKMNINPQKIGGIAGRRHQLHSLLAEAYMNREAIEDKIAQGKRNRREAGNKYGF